MRGGEGAGERSRTPGRAGSKATRGTGIEKLQEALVARLNRVNVWNIAGPGGK